ncbi:hypothetical protein ACEPAF_1361 [Sanghuangporus sanghuang]
MAQRARGVESNINQTQRAQGDQRGADHGAGAGTAGATGIGTAIHPPGAGAMGPTDVNIDTNASNASDAARSNDPSNTNRRSSTSFPASRTNSTSDNSNSSTTTTTAETTNAPRPRRTSTSSQSIHVHAELFMQLIHEERALASLGVRAEVEALRRALEEREREVDSLRGEVESMRRAWAGASVQQRGASASPTASFPSASPPASAHTSASGSYGAHSDIRLLRYELESKRKEVEALKKVLEDGKAARGELAVPKCALEAVSEEHRKARGELDNLRRENEELRKMISERNANANPEVRVKMEEGAEQNIENVNPNPYANLNANAEAQALRRRCEELGSENEKLRKSEAILRQRIEIFESLRASASNALPSLGNHPSIHPSILLCIR